MMMPPVSSSNTETIFIKEPADIIFAQLQVRKLAEKIGFSSKEQWQISIAASEASTNMLKFAQGGTLFLRHLYKRQGIEFEASDKGPGIIDIEKSMMDGFSENKNLDFTWGKRGMGCGLSAIKRMMDELDIVVKKEGGTSVIARKFIL